MVTVNVTTTEIVHQQSINRASAERQQSWVLHLVQSKGSAMVFTHNQRNGSCHEQK
jgi:hypothetical protein